MHERAQVLPADERARITSDVDACVHHAVVTEWPYMTEHGELTERGGDLPARLRKDEFARAAAG